jgi:hypothetical protein
MGDVPETEQQRGAPSVELMDSLFEAKREWHRRQADLPVKEKFRILLEMQRFYLPLIERQRPLKPWERPLGSSPIALGGIPPREGPPTAGSWVSQIVGKRSRGVTRCCWGGFAADRCAQSPEATMSIRLLGLVLLLAGERLPHPSLAAATRPLRGAATSPLRRQIRLT